MNKTSYMNHARAWEYAEESELNSESPYLQGLRAQAEEAGFIPGCLTQGAFLQVVARASQAKSIILVGTGSLVEAVRLIEGQGQAGQFTVVDSSSVGVNLVRNTFHQLRDHTGVKMRAVNDRAKSYFSRLNSEDYDLIVVTGDTRNYADALEEAPRLLKAHGQILFTDALSLAQESEDGGVLNPANRSERSSLLRQAIQDYQESDAFDACLLPIGSGILLATKR